ncbi:MAG: thioredoxin domain-containing protein [Desulfocurvibacter africanus]
MPRLCAILWAFLLLAASFPIQAQAQQIQDQQFKEQLARTLKQNPEILLDAIRQIDGDVLDVLQQAAIKRRQQEIQREQERERQNPLKPVVDPSRILQGPARAPVTIVEYSDFQCPYCERLALELDKALAQLGTQARMVFKHNPVRSHESAMTAAKLFEAVSMQDKQAARKLYHLLFANQNRLDELGEKGLLDLAVQAGAKREATLKAMQSPEVQKRIEADMAEFRSFGFSGVPVLVINGVSVRGAVSAEEILQIVRDTSGTRAK